jgi:hypothetical protein
MIRYRLNCKKGHQFEGWFANSAAFDRQAKRGDVTCPRCGTSKVTKALMAPNIAKSDKGDKPKRRPKSTERPAPEMAKPEAAKPETQRVAAHSELASAMRKLRAEIESKSEYVGTRFPEEARKIHYEEAPARSIRGQASPEETVALREEGIDVLSLPKFLSRDLQ